VNRRNLKSTNFEHALRPGLELKLNWSAENCFSCYELLKFDADNFGSKLRSILARKLWREERGKTNQVKINASEHNDLFTEVRFRRT
jgi:hypothetical protein